MIDNYKNSVPSPYKVKEGISPLQEEINKNITSFNISVQIEEDKEMLSLFKHIPNFVAFKTTLRKEDEIIGIGSGVGVVNRLNKFVERTVIFAKNASLIDAMVRSTKILDALYINPNNQESIDVLEDEPASDKQKSYLQKLITLNITDIKERNKWELELGRLTKNQASEKIQSFINS